MIRVGRKDELGAQYIGRGSPLGNPFIIGTHGDRDEVCDKYESYIREQLRQKNPVIVAEIKRLVRLASKGDLTLGCFCTPKRCHGDTIKKLINSVEHIL